MDPSHPVGSIVWVKLEGGRWWPGEVVSETACPDIIKSLRKQPIAVVKFFDEDCFHIVKSGQIIYPYECQKKEEFLKRGKDLKLSGKDSFSLRLKFDADVSKAESVCKGNIQNLPEKTTDKTPPKSFSRYSYMKMASAERFDYNINISEREGARKLYLNENNDLGMPRIRKQPSTPKAEDTVYTCDTCSYHTTRIDNIIRHHKTHSDPYRFHPSKETEHRFVFEKLSSVKSHKKSKVLSKSNSNKKSVSRKKLFSRSFSPMGSINRIRTTKKRERNELHKDNSSPKRKKAKLKTSPTKVPFTNPFEEEEEEEKRKLEEIKVLEEEKKNEERLKQLSTTESLDVPSDGDEKESFDGLKKAPESLAVAWEEFIKDSNLKSRTSERTLNSATKEQTMDETEKFDDKVRAEVDKILNDDGLLKQKLCEDDLLKQKQCELSSEEDVTVNSSGVSVDENMLQSDGADELKNASPERHLESNVIKTLDTDDSVNGLLDKHFSAEATKRASDSSEEWNKIVDQVENKSIEENVLKNKISDKDNPPSTEKEETIIVKDIIQDETNDDHLIETNTLQLTDVVKIEQSLNEIDEISAEMGNDKQSLISEELMTVDSQDLSKRDDQKLSLEDDSKLSALNTVKSLTSLATNSMENGVLSKKENEKLPVMEKDESQEVKNEELSVMETDETSILETVEVENIKDTSTVQLEKIQSDLQVVDVRETVSPNHCVVQELSNELIVEQAEPDHIQHITMSVDIPTEEIVMTDNEMSTGEIIVGDTTLHPTEIVVGDEIEVQEIEIHSVVDDGIHTNEIVIGDDIVMQPMEIQLVPDTSEDIEQIQINNPSVAEESVVSYEHNLAHGAEKQEVSSDLILQPIENQGSELNVHYAEVMVDQNLTSSIENECGKLNLCGKEIHSSSNNDHKSLVASEMTVGNKPMYMTAKPSSEILSEDVSLLNSHGKQAVCNVPQECSTNSATDIGSRISIALESNSDDELPPVFEDKSYKNEYFSKEDIILVKHGRYFWPAVICNIYEKKKKMAIKFVDAPNQNNMVIPFRRVLPYTPENCQELLKQVSKESDVEKQLKTSISFADEYLRKKVLRGEMPSPIKYFQCPFIYDAKELVAETEKTAADEMVNWSLEDTTSSSDQEIENIDESHGYTSSRIQEHTELFSRIKSEACKEHLIKILRNETDSSRHKAFFDCSLSVRNRLKFRAGFGVLKNYSQIEDLCNYLMVLLLKEIVNVPCFDKFSYIFNVWVPEALIWALGDLHSICYKEAERVYLNGNDWFHLDN